MTRERPRRLVACSAQETNSHPKVRPIRGAIRASLTIALLMWSVAGEAHDYAAPPLYRSVESADAIVVATVTDGDLGVVRVDETLKGKTSRTIRLVNYIDTFMRLSDRRPLVNGAQELMFLKKEDENYAPLQMQLGRWPIHSGLPELPGFVAELGLPDYRRTIVHLAALQEKARDNSAGAFQAYIEGMRSADPQIRLWAAATAHSTR